MPEIAAVGLVGALITFVLVNLNLYWVHRSFSRPDFRRLNLNLAKVQKYWSLEQGRVLEYNSSSDQADLQKKDYQKSTRSAFLFGTMMIFLSWFGLLIFTLYFLSTHKFAKSRLEQRVFDSELVRNENLTSREVESLLTELESLGR